MNNRQSFLFLVTVIAILLVSLVIIFSPNTIGLTERSIRFPKIDTIGHFTSFFLLTWVTHSLLKIHLTVTIITLIFYGGLTELGQSYLGFRNADITDFYADVAGVLFFAFVKYSYLFLTHRLKLTKPTAEKGQANCGATINQAKNTEQENGK